LFIVDSEFRLACQKYYNLNQTKVKKMKNVTGDVSAHLTVLADEGYKSTIFSLKQQREKKLVNYRCLLTQK